MYRNAIRKTGYYRRKVRSYRRYARRFGRAIYNTRPSGILHTVVSKTIALPMPQVGTNYFFYVDKVATSLYSALEFAQLSDSWSRFKVVSATIFITMANPNLVFTNQQLVTPAVAQFNSVVCCSYQPSINPISAPVSSGETIEKISAFDSKLLFSSSSLGVQKFKFFPKLVGTANAIADQDGFVPLDITNPVNYGNYYFGTDWWPFQAQGVDLTFLTYHIEFSLRLTAGQ